ncbi:MAG: protein kinase [Pirellulales bacterium]
MAFGCPARESYIDFLDGLLPEEQLDAVSNHLESCRECQNVVDTLDQLHDTLVSELRELRDVAPDTGLPAVCAEALARVELFYDFPLSKEDPPAALKLGWLGKYELLGRLGQGGMGTVYLARQARLDRRVALKVLSPSRIADKNSLARFESEMRAVGKLEHPNIVRAYDADEFEGVHFLVMEAVSGCDLAQLMKRRSQPFPIAEACEIIRQAAVGLEHAHQHGLVHRDIKPSNLILTTAGDIKLLDLGLAVLQPGVRVGDELTEESQLVGTPEYIAPEQAIDSHAIGPRADIYSLGVTFYKLLTGRTPYGEGHRDKPLRMILAHLHSPIVDIRTLRNDIPAALAEIVHRMLAKNPAERFASAAEVSTSLAPWVGASRPAALLECGPDVHEQALSGTASFEQPTTGFGETVDRHRTSEQRSATSAPACLDNRAAGADVPPWFRRPVLAATMAAGFLILASTIWIIVRDRDGREVGRFQVPKGGSAVIVDDGDGAPPKPSPAKKLPPGPADSPAVSPGGYNDLGRPLLKAADLPREAITLHPSGSMSATSLVSHPEKLPGVLSWTVESTIPRAPLRCAAWNPLGTLLATGGDDGVVRIWSEKGELQRMLVTSGYDVVDLEWSPRGDVLASCSSGVTGRIELWEVDTGRAIRSCSGPLLYNKAGLAWSPTGSTLAIANGSTLRLWRVATEESPREILATTSTVVSWSPDGKRLALAGEYATQVVLWNTETEQPEQALPQTPAVLALAWSPQGHELATGGRDFGIRIWQPGEKQPSRTIALPQGQEIYDLGWSPDGKQLVFGGAPGSGTVNGDEITSLPQFHYGAGWSCNGVIAGVNEQGEVLACDRSGNVKFRHGGPHDNQLGAIIGWSPDGAQTAVYSPWPEPQGWRLQLFDLTTGAPLSTLGSSDMPPANAVVWVPDGRYVVTQHHAGGPPTSYVAAMWEVATGRMVWSRPHTALQRQNPVSSSGRFVGAFDTEKNSRLVLETSTGKVVSDLGADKAAQVIAWSADDSILAMVGIESPAITLWNTDTGDLLGELACQGTYSPAFHPDGKRILTSGVMFGDKGGLGIWDLASRQLLQYLAMPDGRCAGFVLPESKQFVGLRDHRNLRVWDSDAELQVDYAGGLPWRGSLRVHVTPDRRVLLAESERQGVFALELATGRRQGCLIGLPHHRLLLIGEEGHFRAVTPRAESTLAYVVNTPRGQETLSVREFADRFRRPNDPARAHLVTPQRIAQTAGLKRDTRANTAGVTTGEPAVTAAMSRLALVGHPAPLPGVRSWSLETRGHRGAVRATACSPDGRLFASGGDDGTVRLWDVATGRLVRMLVAHNQPVLSLAFSSDNQFLASGGYADNEGTSVHIWRTATGRRERVFGLHGLDAHSLAWAKKPNRIWIAGDRTELLLFDLTSDQPVRTITVGIRAERMSLSPDKNHVAICDNSAAVVYDLDTAMPIAELNCAAPDARIAWAPDSQRVALTSANGVIELWNVRENKKLTSFREKREQPRATEISWAPQGELVALTGADQEIWDVSTGAKVAAGPIDGGTALGLPAWSPDGRLLIQACEDSRIRIYDVPRYTLVRKIDGHRVSAYPTTTRGAAWSSDGRGLAIFTGSADERANWLRIVDTETGEDTASLSSASDHAVTWRPNTRELAVTRWTEGSGAIVFYGNGLGQPIRTLELGKTSRPSPLTFSPDGNRFALSVDGIARIYSVDNLAMPVELPGTRGADLLFAWSPDGNQLALAAQAGTEVAIWDIAERTLVRKFPNSNLEQVRELAWSPDGTLLVTVPPHCRSFHFIDPHTGDLLKTVSNPTGGWGGFWPENVRQFAAFNYGSACRWIDLGTGADIRTVRGYQPFLSALSPDRRSMASAEENALYLWNFDTGRRHGTQVWLTRYHSATIGASGHYRVSHPLVQSELQYVVDTGAGQEMLNAAKFAADYGWMNDPAQAKLWQAIR